MEVSMFSVLKPVVEYIQQASQARHAQHSTDKHPTTQEESLGSFPSVAARGSDHMECHEEAVSPQEPQPRVTLVGAAMSAHG